MSEVTDSIMLSVKKLNGVAQDNSAWDDDFILWINGALSDLNQLGIGPADGYAIEDETETWEDFLGDSPLYNRVKTYVGRHVRLDFDPPQSGFAMTMMKEQLAEQAWRLTVAQDDIDAEQEAG